MEESVEYYLEKGRAEKAAWNYYEAREAFTKAIEIDPTNAQAYYERARAGGMGEGIEYYEKALELDPNIGDAYWGIAEDYLRKGYPYEHIIPVMMKHVSVNPNDPDVYRHRAIVYIWHKRYHHAIDDLSIAIAMDLQGNDNDYRERGLCYSWVWKYEEAIKDVSQAIKMNPENPLSYDIRGESYAKLHKFDLALQDLTSAIKIYEKIVEDMDDIVDAYTIITVESLIRCYAQRGMCYTEICSYQEANDDFNTAIYLGEYYEIISIYIGLCYHKLGEHHKAIKLLDEAIYDRCRYDGCLSSDAFQFRGDSYEAIGELGKRDQDYHTAKFIAHLEKNATENVFKQKYDRSTGTIIFNDAA